MTDRHRQLGEGSEAGLVESCWSEVCVLVIKHDQKIKKKKTKEEIYGFHKVAGSEAGNPYMHTNGGRQVHKASRKEKKKPNQ